MQQCAVAAAPWALMCDETAMTAVVAKMKGYYVGGVGDNSLVQDTGEPPDDIQKGTKLKVWVASRVSSRGPSSVEPVGTRAGGATEAEELSLNSVYLEKAMKMDTFRGFVVDGIMKERNNVRRILLKAWESVLARSAGAQSAKRGEGQQVAKAAFAPAATLDCDHGHKSRLGDLQYGGHPCPAVVGKEGMIANVFVLSAIWPLDIFRRQARPMLKVGHATTCEPVSPSFARAFPTWRR